MTTIINADWIRRAFAVTGKSKSGLASALGRSPQVVTAILNGREIGTTEVPTILKYFEFNEPSDIDRRNEFGNKKDNDMSIIDMKTAHVAISQILLLAKPHGNQLPQDVAEKVATLILELATIEPEGKIEKRTPDMIRSEISGIASALLH